MRSVVCVVFQAGCVPGAIVGRRSIQAAASVQAVVSGGKLERPLSKILELALARGRRNSGIHFLATLVIFGITYFGIVLPVFQFASRRFRGRNFAIRLGTPWNYADPEHRWDVLLSFFSFVVALGVSLFIVDVFLPLADARS